MEQNGSGPGPEILKEFYQIMEQENWPEKRRKRFRCHLGSLQDALGTERVVDRRILDIWREELREKKGLSKRSIEEYITDVNHFLRWAGYGELCYRPGRPAKLVGQRFGRLVVLRSEKHDQRTDRSIYWRCRCDCGKEVVVASNRLLRGSVVSCGCLKTERLMECNVYVDGTCLRQVLSNRVRSDNTSGYPGAYAKRSKWMARIQYKGKIYSLGSYPNKEDAIRARKQAEEWVKNDAEQLMAMVKGTAECAG